MTTGLTQVAPGISRAELRMPVLLGARAGLRVNVYVLEAADGLHLVDCGPFDLYAELRALVATSFPGKRIRRIYLTHGHGDHAGAGARCANDRIEVWAAPGDREMLRNGGPGGVPRRFRYPAFEATHSLVQGGQIPLNDEHHLEVLPLPGHTDGSVCFNHPGGRALLCGDLVFGPSTGYWTTFLVQILTSRRQPADELRTQMDSLSALRLRLAAKPRTLLLPGHGPPGHFDSGATSLDRSERILRQVLRTKRGRGAGSGSEN